MTDTRIKKANRKEFDEKGWTVINLGLSQSKINNYQSSLINIRNKASEIQKAPRRIYYDHLTSFNLAAIELPFNQLFIDDNIKELFQEINLGSLVCSMMKWDKTTCNLARLFCMKDYNYRGRWHRDYNEINNVQNDSSSHKKVIAALYMFKQSGFRMLKKEYDFGGIRSLVKNKEIDNLICSHNMPIKPPRNSYDILKAPEGSVILINPLLLHQGTNYGSRLDYHLLFSDDVSCKEKQNSFQDFYVSEHYLETYDFIKNSKILTRKSNNFPGIPFDQRDSLIKRFINSVEYRIPILNILRQYISFKTHLNSNEKIRSSWSPDLFSNSIWQRD